MRIHLSLALLVALLGTSVIAQNVLDLRNTVLVAPVDGPVGKAADFLSDAVYERSGIRWYIRDYFPGATRVVVCTADTVPAGISLPKGLSVPDAPEGFALGVEGDVVIVAGRDPRGALFGAGRLLRALTLREGEISLSRETRIATAPKYPMRVHQLGYRNTATSYDLWDVDAYEQYLREMAIFGTNGAELIQDGPPEDKDSVLMAEPQWTMNLKLATLLDAYDLEVFVWYPVPILTGDRAQYDREVGYRERFFNEISRLDHLFVPGGDPGDNHPEVLMPALEVMANMLHKRFPDAKVFVSNQKMNVERNDWFFNYIQEKQPAWLGGYAFGPGTIHDIAEARERLPKQYPIRRYPDITHNVRCEFGVPHFDSRLAQTLGREGVNPRPSQYQYIHNAFDEFSDGFGSYSDGIHDDLNKMVFSALGWDPDADIQEIVLDYGRVFFGEDAGPAAAEGLWMLQENMTGDFLKNETVPKTLAKWREVGEKATPAVRESWRYKMYLMRALFDQFTRARYIAEMEYEAAAYAALAQAPDIGVAKAIEAARQAYAQADTDAIEQGLYEEMHVIADDLFHRIGQQFSVKAPYFTRNPERGALLDALEVPLNDRPWVENQFDQILAMNNEADQRARIDLVLNWEDPGAGGFYDDLGDPERQPHLQNLGDYESAPGEPQRVIEGHYRWLNNVTDPADPNFLKVDPNYRYSMLTSAQAPDAAPVVLVYDGLDPSAQYRVRVVEFGRYRATVDLTADGQYKLHGPQKPDEVVWPKEYDIPKEATADGKLELTWGLVEGRGTQIAEVWLMKK